MIVLRVLFGWFFVAVAALALYLLPLVPLFGCIGEAGWWRAVIALAAPLVAGRVWSNIEAAIAESAGE